MSEEPAPDRNREGGCAAVIHRTNKLTALPVAETNHKHTDL